LSASAGVRILTIALDQLTLGRAALYRALLDESDRRSEIHDFKSQIPNPQSEIAATRDLIGTHPSGTRRSRQDDF